MDRSDIKNILIRGVNWLGDAVMTTPAIGTVRQVFSDSRITLLATPLVAEMFSSHPWINNVVVYEPKGKHKGLRGRFKMASNLRKHNFDLAIILPNSLDSAIIPWLAGIPKRIGYATDCRGLFLTNGVSASKRLMVGHQSGYYLKMLEYSGIISEKMPQLLFTTPDEDAGMVSLLADKGISSNDFLIGVNPGATYGSAKRWYPERFAAVADELAMKWGAKIVITGGKGEIDIAGEISGMMINPSLNLAGKTGVRELMALIKRADFFITNDSGPMHIAAAFNVPLVAIFGSTDSSTTYPLSDKAVIVRKPFDCAPCMKRECPTDHRCMTAVTVDDVINAAESLCVARRHDG
ncbi:MAG: lipopolysaccharide heptosyltransferase II [Desulfuromonadales bacterium]|nr:lipopolysaccharide heptosyltransferase II [Desulfuromonadales bacterium]